MPRPSLDQRRLGPRGGVMNRNARTGWTRNLATRMLYTMPARIGPPSVDTHPLSIKFDPPSSVNLSRRRYKYISDLRHGFTCTTPSRLLWPHQLQHPRLEESHPLRPCLSPSSVGDELLATSRVQSADGTSPILSTSKCRPHIPYRCRIRCDKKVPCGSCTRRGCVTLCPNGL